MAGLLDAAPSNAGGKGLLDFLTTDAGSRLGLTLLAASSPRLRGLSDLISQQDQMQQANMQRKAFDASMADRAARIKQQEQQLAAAQRKQQALPGLLQGLSQGAGIDAAAALAAGYAPDEVSKMAALRNVNKDKVARTVKGIGADGREYEYQVDEFGNKVGEGLAQFRAPLMQNLGDKTVALDPYTLDVLKAFAQGMSPESRASNALGWANNALAQQRLAMDASKSAGDGYVFNAQLGGYVPKVPGGGDFIPLTGAAESEKPLTESQSKSLLFGSRMDEANRIIDEAEKYGVERPSAIKGAAEALPFVGGALGALVNASPIVSRQEQKLEQAQRDFINAVLRKESGAVIGADEFENARKQYFPAFGDSEAVIQQKKANRELATKLLMQEGGAVAKDGFQQPKDKSPSKIINELPAANSSNRGQRIRDTQTGQILVSDGMQWRPE